MMSSVNMLVLIDTTHMSQALLHVEALQLNLAEFLAQFSRRTSV